MENKELNEVLIACVTAINIILRYPSKVNDKEERLINLGPVEETDFNFFQDLSTAQRYLTSIPEINGLLEKRMLEMQLNAVNKKLNDIRGSDGK